MVILYIAMARYFKNPIYIFIDIYKKNNTQSST